MSKLDAWIENKIVQNLFVWFFVFLLLVSTIQANDRVPVAIFALLLLAPAVYVNNLLILPYFKRKMWLFFLLFTINIIVFTGIAVLIVSMALKQELNWTMFVNFFGIMVLALVFASAIKIARDSIIKKQKVKEAELKLLKAQLNPHFLFNTLNNLYGLSVVKSEKLPDLMLKLSDLLRYSLYETKETLVPLKKEVSYIENYIALEKIRLEDQTEIHFKNNIQTSTKKIAPMLLIVFVENAFKHLDISEEGKNKVSITLKEHDTQLVFTCTNTINIKKRKEANLEKSRTGIGLQNAKKRLSLIYAEKHNLKIDSTAEMYTVALTLDL